MRAASVPKPTPFDEGVAAIMALDLDPLRGKLMLPAPEGEGWSEEEARVAEMWYRRFLVLVLKYPDHPCVPNAQIDAFWHVHILDTRRYAEDCEAVFGQFVHHYPYFGLNGDAAERDAAFDETNWLYRHEFGEDCTVMGRTFFQVIAGNGCNHSGSGTGCGQGCGKK